MSQALRKVALIGSGNWGSAIAKIIGDNVLKSSRFDKTVAMYVHEEMVNGKKLTEIINERHENVKYLPGIKLPENIVAVPTVNEVCYNADVFIFVLPHQFVGPISDQMKDLIPPTAMAISLIKGFSSSSVGIEIMSDVITNHLGINCSALMGANLAHEVANEKFCESTIGCSDKSLWPLWKELFHCSYFKVNCVEDVRTVELCGALKNTVALGAGFVDAMEAGDNTKAAIIRLGLMEMRKFTKLFSDKVNDETFLESCGVADLITTCYGGRNRKCAEAFARTGKSFELLEKEMLNGQKLQGTHTTLQVYNILNEKRLIDEFPLFTAIHRICYENEKPQYLLDHLKQHF